MTLRPATPEELAQALHAAHEARSRVEHVDLSALIRVLEYTPEDMTVTVEAGTTLASLQQTLAARDQWLPIDPPDPNRLTLAALLDSNASGPRRYGCGAIRDHLIGLRVALAGGRLIRSGGKVVKNVAGYDLMKLFIGARGTLGVIVEATFKLLPLPEAEAFVQSRCDSLAAAEPLITAVLDSELTPTVFDLHNVRFADERTPILLEGGAAVEISTAATANLLPLPARHERGEGRGEGNSKKNYPPLPGPLLPPREEREKFHRPGAASSLLCDPASTLVLGFSGPRLAVDWQLALARKLGFTESATLDFEARFHAPDQPPAHRISVLPSRLVESLRSLGSAPFVARAGNGIIFHRAGIATPKPDLPRVLWERVKQTFDPNRIFPELPL